MTYAEAKPAIIEQLTAGAVRDKMDTLTGWLEEQVAQIERPGQAEQQNVYEYLRGKATLSAEKVLARPVSVKIGAMRLDKAMEMLAEAADLEAVCYPWDTGGALSVAPSVRVTLEAKDMPLGEALDRITEQVFGRSPATKPAGGDAPAEAPRLRWAMCEKFGGVLFPVGGGQGMDLFPLSAGDTGLVDLQKLLDDEMLRESYTSPTAGRGRPLLLIARCAEPLDRPPQMPVLIKKGQAGQRMYVRGARPGRVLWKLADAVGAHAPPELTDELRRRVADDLKLEGAFDLAVRRAEELGEIAATSGVDAAAAEAKLEARRTGLFSRKTFVLRSAQGPILAIPGSFPAEQKLNSVEQIVMGGYFRGQDLDSELVWSGVTGLTLPTGELRERFVTRAFGVAPKNVEPPYPKDPPATAVVPVESDRSVVVIERADFQPVVAGEYRARGRLALVRHLKTIQMKESRASWFSFEKVAERVGYKPPKP